MTTQYNERRNDERRKDERRYFKTTAICSIGPSGSERTLFGQVINLSVWGVQILCKEDIVSGEELDLTFMNEHRDTIAEAHARVVWHHKEGPGLSVSVFD